MRIYSRVLVTAVLVLVAPASSGAVTIGSDKLGAPSPGFYTCASAPCVLIQDTIAGTPVRVPSGNWVVTSWRVRGAEGTVALEVLEPTGGTSTSLEGRFSAESPDAQGAGSAADQVQEFPARLSAKGGHMIGLALAPGAQIGGVAGPTDTVVFEAPPTASFSTGAYGHVEQLLQVTIEPDTDGDGFGDQSQDGCPTSPATQGACPQPPGPPDPLAELKAGGKPTLTISKARIGAPKGTAAIKLVNPHGYPLTGTLMLTRKGKSLGSRKYSIPPSGATTARVKLSVAGRRALRRLGKLRLSALATVKGPVGAQGRSRVTLILTKRRQAPPKTNGTAFRGRTTNLDVEMSFDVIGNEMRGILGGITVTCFYPGGASRSGVEVYDPPAPFPLGQKTEQFADNKPSAILGSETRKRYTMDARLDGDTVTGTIQVSYAFFTINPSTGFAQGSSCVGEDTFTAHRR